jgi:hypothetical protein
VKQGVIIYIGWRQQLKNGKNQQTIKRLNQLMNIFGSMKNSDGKQNGDQLEKKKKKDLELNLKPFILKINC